MGAARRGDQRDGTSGAAPARPRADPPLDVPALPRTYVPPEPLWAMLDGTADAAVTMVVAPAGSGKTLGTAGWVREHRSSDSGERRPVGWLSAARLDAAQLRRAVDALTAAGAAPGAAGSDGSRPDGSRPGGSRPGDPEPGDPRPGAVLVVDDAQRLSPDCLAVVEDLLERGTPAGRVLLLTRWDLALSRVVPQLLGTLAVIRGDALRLDAQHARALVRRHAPDCPPDVLDTVVQQAGGWCAALVLAARAVRTAAPTGLEAWPVVTGPAISDFVAHEVLAGLGARQRHLLMSVAHEPTVTVATAAHLAHDPAAGRLLEELEVTGLLVGREPGPPGADVYRVHPVLAEAARRQLDGGGPDAVRARATIARAARIDLASGDLGSALTRTLVGAGPDRTGALLATHGLPMVLGGDSSQVRAVAARCADALGAHRSARLALAVDRWLSGDERGVAAGLPGGGPAGPVADPRDAVIGRLLQALIGLEPLSDACAAGVRAAARTGADHRPGRRPLLLALVGEAQLWLGEQAVAEVTLAAAAAAARSDGSDRLLAEVLAQLALIRYVLGRAPAGAELARRAQATWPAQTRTGLAEEVLGLASLHDDPWSAASGRPLPRGTPGRAPDRFVARLGQVLRLALQGRCAAAQDLLDSPVELPALPVPLDTVRLTVRTLVAAAEADVTTLGACADRFAALGADAEADLARGLLQAHRGDLPDALVALRRATAQPAQAQPDTVGVALVTAAQVADTLGDRGLADVLLEQGLRRAEQRRDALSMVGWLGHVTPVHALLARSAAAHRSPWTAHVLAQARAHGSLAALVSRSTPTPSESSRARRDLVASLTPRERDVLDRLARGASYADIAADLVVSTNTVKTHVASLYAKLGAGRRSEALATARTLELL